MFHTRFFTVEEDVFAQFEAMKISLAEIVAIIYTSLNLI